MTVPCEALAPLVVQLRNLEEGIARLDRTIVKIAQKDETARRLMSIPGFGPITASAMTATIQDVSAFASPREFAAFLGLTPKQNSSGGKQKLGRVSGAVSPQAPHRSAADVGEEAAREEAFQACRLALANKMARIAFAILRSKTVYREIPA